MSRHDSIMERAVNGVGEAASPLEQRVTPATVVRRDEPLARRTTLWIGSPPGHPIRAQLKNVRGFDRLEELLDALDERQRLLATRPTTL